ncbi:DUF4390 domain-containing protein [uncultured Thiodictyon sp.]|uniref:DUF4390 domain-containing protein n=1 Tax=uncultured Thiodictyon sp. TaxID=1846217 RepID=UPI0025DCF79C|nr:DUF4390 domain-containing protein [uncultured Thiodictyon sp.]
MTGHRSGRRPGRTWWVAVLAVLLASHALAADFRVTEVQTRLVAGTYTLDALIDYRFSPEALEALANGVPLTILMQFQVRLADAWIWESSVTDLELRYAIRHRPLSETYEVYRLPGTAGRTFVTREAAIASLGEIKGLDLVDQSRLQPGKPYEVHLKVSLEIEALPLPLRPTAYLSGAWKLASPWTKWPLTH